jgi:hypothetical protein
MARTPTHGNGFSSLWEQEVGGSNPPAPIGKVSLRAKFGLARALTRVIWAPIWKVEGGAEVEFAPIGAHFGARFRL